MAKHPIRRDPIMAGALADVAELAAGWDVVMLCIEREVRFSAFGCRWSALIQLILDTDDGLPSARVCFEQRSVPADSAVAAVARKFEAAVRRRLKKAGYDIDDIRSGDYDAAPKRIEWRGDKELKSLEDVKREGRWLADLRLAPEKENDHA